MLRPDTFALTALLALLTALGPVAVDMYLPSFPEIGRQLSASPATVQLTLSLYLVAYAIGQVIYGPLSDRYGRIPVLRLALAIYCVASAACALAPTIELLLLARASQALGSSGAITTEVRVIGCSGGLSASAGFLSGAAGRNNTTASKAAPNAATTISPPMSSLRIAQC